MHWRAAAAAGGVPGSGGRPPRCLGGRAAASPHAAPAVAATKRRGGRAAPLPLFWGTSSLGLGRTRPHGGGCAGPPSRPTSAARRMVARPTASGGGDGPQQPVWRCATNLPLQHPPECQGVHEPPASGRGSVLERGGSSLPLGKGGECARAVNTPAGGGRGRPPTLAVMGGRPPRPRCRATVQEGQHASAAQCVHVEVRLSMVLSRSARCSTAPLTKSGQPHKTQRRKRIGLGTPVIPTAEAPPPPQPSTPAASACTAANRRDGGRPPGFSHRTATGVPRRRRRRLRMGPSTGARPLRHQHVRGANVTDDAAADAWPRPTKQSSVAQRLHNRTEQPQNARALAVAGRRPGRRRSQMHPEAIQHVGLPAHQSASPLAMRHVPVIALHILSQVRCRCLSGEAACYPVALKLTPLPPATTAVHRGRAAREARS